MSLNLHYLVPKNGGSLDGHMRILMGYSSIVRIPYHCPLHDDASGLQSHSMRIARHPTKTVH